MNVPIIGFLAEWVSNNIKPSDAVPILGLVATWIASNIDLIITRGVGVATLVFTVLKIWKLVKDWNKKEKE